MKSYYALGLAILFLILPVQAQQPSKNPSDQQATGANGTAAAAKVPADSEYKIGPQDVLQIDVWKEPEITRTIPVRPDGKISLPLLNDVQAAGLTAMQLSTNIRDSLGKYLTNPQVTVTVTQINSQRVFVTGEVAKSGALPLLPGMTALQALSSSGGFTQFARTKGIYILRNQNGKQVKLPYNYKEVLKGKQDDVVLQPGDIVVVP
jgi:polysaccharide biosynthesis/export protein